MRRFRKREHIENYLRSTYVGNPFFDFMFLYHNSLPEVDFKDINTSTVFLNKSVDFPLMINAMTGGSDFAEDINTQLAQVANEFNIPIAVGSQTIALEDAETIKSFAVVRDIVDKGIVIGNLSGRASVDEAKNAIEMIRADALQIHLNPAQELAMTEGERDFKNILFNIEKIVNSVDVPIIVKEVGFGLSSDVIKRLYNVGVRNVDVSGFGGTNFFEIENLRNPDSDLSELYGWGIPTALAIIEAKKLNYDDLKIIGSGGVKNSEHLVKSLVAGADMVAISGEILSYLIHGGIEYTLKYVENLIYKAKIIMLLIGAKDINDLHNIKYKVTGELKDILEDIDL